MLRFRHWLEMRALDAAENALFRAAGVVAVEVAGRVVLQNVKFDEHLIFSVVWLVGGSVRVLARRFVGCFELVGRR